MTSSTAAAGPSLWRPMIAAMSKTGGSSVVSGLLGALATKIIASMLGPGAIALIQTAQQLRDGAVTAATANGRTALVQGASSLAGAERREYVRTVALLFSGGTFAILLAMAAGPREFLAWFGIPSSIEPLLPWLAATVALLSAFVFLAAILNAVGAIERLAVLQLAAPVAAAVTAWPVAKLVRSGHPGSIAGFLAAPAALTMIAAAVALRGHRGQLRPWFRGTGRWWSAGAAGHFFSISGAMLASGLVATAVLLAVRGSITRHEGSSMTGQFDAAWNVSMNQATLILGSMQIYYLPSLTAAGKGSERARQIRATLMLATLASVPVIVALAALKPLVVSVLYSRAFPASGRFLRWTLLGDYFKVSSWALAMPILAAREMGPFLVLDLTAHAVFFGAATLLARSIEPAEAAAIGFLLSYVSYLALCCVYASRRLGFRLDGAALSAWLSGGAIVAAASISTWSDSAVAFAKAAAWTGLAMAYATGFAWFLKRREA